MEKASEAGRGRVTAVHNLTEYFRDALADALASQHVELDEHTAHYVVSLLVLYSRTEVSHQDTRRGQRWVSLVDLLAQASSTSSPVEREALLQRLGDVSLFVAGFFAHGFARRLIDVDYHVAIGGRAYGTLAATPMSGPRRALSTVFAELARKFQPVVDVLGEIADSARVWGPDDVLRLYELWLKTGSRRAQGLLRQLGVAPAPVSLRPS
ncbi:MAG: hypothetical protein DIU62_012380 [Pseudomonadota bacterium]|jgi:hypothetical protein|nr:MAG: hypothetical protein DIU62_14520 [Pseudomonadota bacterium]